MIALQVYNMELNTEEIAELRHLLSKLSDISPALQGLRSRLLALDVNERAAPSKSAKSGALATTKD